MLTLEQIHRAVAKLMERDDENAVLSGIEDIFYELMYVDQPMFIAFSDNVPFASVTVNDAEHSYVRIFSHEELAQKYAEKNENIEIRNFSIVETLQLARFCLLKGTYGYILNEGDKWFVIPFSRYLSIFFTKVLDDDANFSDEISVKVLEFLCEMHHNSQFQYGAVFDENGNLKSENDDTVIVSTSDQLSADPSGQEIQPISIQSLYRIHSKNVRIIREDEERVFPSNLLFGALDLCGYRQNENASFFVPEYADEFINLSGDWKLDNIENLKLVVTPRAVSEEEIIPGASEKDDPTKTVEQAAGNLKNRLSEIKNNVFSKIKTKTDELKEEKLPEKSEKEQKVKSKKKIRVQKKLVFISIFAVILSVFLVKYLSYQHQYKQFTEDIDAQDYAAAYTNYIDHNLGSRANHYLSDHLDILLTKYANNEISAESLSASFSALSNFISVESDLETARLNAAKLELSKNAYVEGNSTTNAYEKLSVWKQVLQIDTVNYNAVLSIVKERKSEYISQLLLDIEYYSTRNRNFAKERYELIAYWYPDSQEAQDLAEIYESEPLISLALYPISISKITIHQETNSYWTLSINWTNESVKTIKNICFSVVALDESGEIVTCKDAQGSWSIFDANDNHTYEPGEGSASGSYNWYNAFYGSFVESVQLTGVNIIYQDGSTTSYTNEIDLNAMQN